MKLQLPVKRLFTFSLVLLLLVPSLSRCFGGFVLTGKWHGFISDINNKWLRWIVFLITSIVYGIAIWVDVLIFNSIEFWSGSNPMARADFDENGERRQVVEKSGEKLVFTHRRFGEELKVDIYKDGTYRGNMVLLRNEPGVFYTEQNGLLAPIDVSVSQDVAAGLRTVRVEAGHHVVERQMSELDYLKLTDRAAAPAM